MTPLLYISVVVWVFCCLQQAGHRNIQDCLLSFYFQNLGIITFKLCFKKLIPVPKLLVCNLIFHLTMIYIICVCKIHSLEQFSTWLDMLVINVELSDFLEY